jgi:hypothetical protein
LDSASLLENRLLLQLDLLLLQQQQQQWVL